MTHQGNRGFAEPVALAVCPMAMGARVIGP